MDIAAFVLVAVLGAGILWRERGSALTCAACLVCFFAGFTGFSVLPVGVGIQVSFAVAACFLAVQPRSLLTAVPSKAVVLWLAVIACSGLMSYAIPESVDGMVPWRKSATQFVAHLAFYMTFLLVWCAANTPENIRKLVKYLIAGGVFCALFAILQVPLVAAEMYDMADLLWNNPSYGGVVAKSSGLISTHIAKSRLGVLRVWGPAMEPSYLGGHLGLVATAWISLALAERRRDRKRWMGAGIFVVLVALVLTQARGALLALCLCGAGQLMFGAYAERRLPRSFAFLLVLVVLAGSWLGLARLAGLSPEEMIQERFGFLSGSDQLQDDYSAGARFAAVRIAWDMMLEYPLLGVGIGNYGFHVYDFLRSEYGYAEFRAGEWHVPFGWPAWALSETGVVGTVLFLLVLYQVISSGVAIQRDPRWAWFSGLHWGFLSLVVGGVAGSHVITPYWWVCIGLIFAARKVGIQQQAAPARRLRLEAGVVWVRP